MDGTAAISNNLEALKRILAGLVAMAGLGCLSSPLAGEDGSARRGKAEPLAEPGEGSDSPPTLPRHLHRAILRLLRPAESAARRLIIAAARGLVVPPPRLHKPRPKPATVEPLLRRFGIAVVVPPADLAGVARILPRLRGRGTVLSRELVEGSKGGGGGGRPRTLTLALFDPPRRVPSHRNRRHVPAHAAPRIRFPGVAVGPHPEVPASGGPRRADDPVDATRLSLRLAALAAALDDLPGQARRFARWKARRDIRRKEPTPGRIRRISPLRPGRPPGGRLARFDPSAKSRRNIREVDEVLAHAHALALYALQYPDTS
jgi:hypothetical protein